MDVAEIDPAIVQALEGLPADFAGFDQVFANKLQPALALMETSRVKAASKAKKGYAIGAGIAGVAILAAIFVFEESFVGFGGGLVGAVTSIFMGADLRGIGKQTKSLMVLPVANEFGLTYEASPGLQAGVYDFREAKILPNWDRETYEDRLTGTRKGIAFDFFEARLEEKRTTRDSKGRTQTKWVTVFSGQCLRFEFPRKFHGRTLVARDAGIFNRFGGARGMDIVKLEDPVFEKAFTVYSTDQVESRFILTPDFMQRLVDMENTFHGGRLRCAFVDGEILIALEGGNMFEPGSLFKPLTNPARIRELLDDFAAIFKLIDAAS